MKTLLLIYMSVYALVFAGVCLAEIIVVPAPERDPLWETVLDLVLLTAGFIGMVFYLKEVEQSQVRLLWKVVAPGLVIAQAWLFTRYLQERPKLIADADPGWTESHIAWLERGVNALLLPSLVINLAFAFGGV